MTNIIKYVLVVLMVTFANFVMAGPSAHGRYYSVYPHDSGSDSLLGLLVIGLICLVIYGVVKGRKK